MGRLGDVISRAKEFLPSSAKEGYVRLGFLAAGPISALFTGMIIDFVLFGRVGVYHTGALPISSLLALPFLAVYISWPRDSLSGKTSDSRLIWDGFMHVLSFILFLVFAYTRLATTQESSYYLTATLRETFTFEEFSHAPAKSLVDVQSIPEFYQYLRGPFVDGLFPESHSDGQQLSYPSIGRGDPVVMRQVRIQPRTTRVCQGTCYPSFQQGTTSREPFGPPGADQVMLDRFHVQGGWSYKNNDYTNLANRTVTPIGLRGESQTIYPPHGFELVIPQAGTLNFTRSTFLAMVDYLEANQWVDQQTRAIILSTTVLDLNIEKWAVIQLIFEVSASGVITPNRGNYLLGALTEFILAGFDNDGFTNTDDEEFFLPFYLQVFAPTLYIGGCVAWEIFNWRWQKINNFVDFSYVLVVLSSYSFRIVAGSHWPRQWQPTPYWYHNWTTTSWAWQWMRDMFGVALLILFLRSLRYLTLLPGVDLFPNAFMKAIPEILQFLVAFLTIFCSFAICFQVIYSSDVWEFNNFGRTLITLWKALIGDVDLQEFQAHYILGSVLFILFTFVALFVTLTMLIAILEDAYQSSKTAHEISLVMDQNVSSHSESTNSSILQPATPGSSHYMGHHEHSKSLFHSVVDAHHKKKLRHRVLQRLGPSRIPQIRGSGHSSASIDESIQQAGANSPAMQLTRDPKELFRNIVEEEMERSKNPPTLRQKMKHHVSNIGNGTRVLWSILPSEDDAHIPQQPFDLSGLNSEINHHLQALSRTHLRSTVIAPSTTITLTPQPNEGNDISQSDNDTSRTPWPKENGRGNNQHVYLSTGKGTMEMRVISNDV